MEDFVCPRCRTSKFQNPSLKMMVNVCGHGLCESCVDLLFLKGSGSCPECRIPLRRNNFRVQLFEDAAVEKEVDIRRRVLRDFNKKEEDFETLAEYNDYLEEVETIIYNLSNDIDIVNTNKKIELYKRDNKEQIQKNKGRLGREEYELEEMIELEKQNEDSRKKEIIQEEINAKKKKIRDKEALIDELMFSEGDAKNIVETFAQQTKEEEQKPLPKKATKFSSGITFSQQRQGGFMPIPIDDGPCYSYKPITFDTEGPIPPTEYDIITKGYKKNVRGETEQERAGGFYSTISCMRALQEALSGLYHSTDRKSVV